MIALSSEVLLPAVKMGMFPGKVLTTQILHIRRRVVGEGQGRRVVADRCTAVGIGHRVAHRHFPGEGPSRGWCTWRRTSSMPCWCSPDSGREERHEVVSEALVLEDELLARLRLTVAISVLDDREGRGLADSRTTGLRHLGKALHVVRRHARIGPTGLLRTVVDVDHLVQAVPVLVVGGQPPVDDDHQCFVPPDVSAETIRFEGDGDPTVLLPAGPAVGVDVVLVVDARVRRGVRSAMVIPSQPST